MTISSYRRLWATLGIVLGSLSPAATQDVPRDIQNLDSAKQAVIRYHDSGRWDLDTLRVVHRAERWIAQRGRRAAKPALVLDIDETALLNWPEERQTDFGYVPELWQKWEAEGKAPASPEVLELYAFSRKHGVTVFFVTGRGERSRAGTAKNLADVGYLGYRHLFMKPAGYHQKSIVRFKSSARAEIERDGYRIIANMGDQWSDLEGGHSERSYKLPNPMYFIP